MGYFDWFWQWSQQKKFTYIRDSMALVQCMDAKKHRTYGDLATDNYRQLTSCFAKAHTVADVFDRYDVKKTSIKSAERVRCTKVTAHTKVFQVIEGRKYSWLEEISNCQRKQASTRKLFLLTRLFLSAAQVRTIKDFLVWNNFHHFRISKWTGKVIQISRGH
jgi:hypothetical protein